MSFTDIKTKVAAMVAAHRMSITMLMLSGLVGMASAAELNASVGPILDSLVLLFVPLLALLLGAVPIIIALAVVSFILGLLALLLNKIRV